MDVQFMVTEKNKGEKLTMAKVNISYNGQLVIYANYPTCPFVTPEYKPASNKYVNEITELLDPKSVYRKTMWEGNAINKLNNLFSCLAYMSKELESNSCTVDEVGHRLVSIDLTEFSLTRPMDGKYLCVIMTNFLKLPVMRKATVNVRVNDIHFFNMLMYLVFKRNALGKHLTIYSPVLDKNHATKVGVSPHKLGIGTLNDGGKCYYFDKSVTSELTKESVVEFPSGFLDVGVDELLKATLK